MNNILCHTYRFVASKETQNKILKKELDFDSDLTAQEKKGKGRAKEILQDSSDEEESRESKKKVVSEKARERVDLSESDYEKPVRTGGWGSTTVKRKRFVLWFCIID